MRPLRIKVDVDGVLRDTFEALCKLYNKEFSESMTVEKITDYDVDVSFPKIRKVLGMSAADWFFKGHPKDCFSARPIRRSPEAIRALREAGHQVLICSHQPTGPGREYTLEFLKAYDIHYDELHFTYQKHFVISDVLIDDSPGFLSLGDDIKICVGYEFNKEVNADYRVKNLWEASQMILKNPEKFMKLNI